MSNGEPWLSERGELARDSKHAVQQVITGQRALWDALVSTLISSQAIDPEQLVLHISIAHGRLPEEATGPISRMIAGNAISALAEASKGGIEAAPPWLKEIISELEPMKSKGGN